MDYTVKTDNELVLACQKGDDVAFQGLMERYIRSVFNFIRQYAKSDDEIEDIVQDSFFKAWRHIKRFQKERPFKPWLFAIARNTALDHIKKRRTSVFSELDDTESELSFADTLQDTGPSAVELFEHTELSEELEASMETLHPDHRAVLVMHYREELTFDEIAIVLGRPMNTVKSWHHRALIKIRPLLSHRKP